MHLSMSDAQKNLDEFLVRYGREGVLILLFRSLLEEMIKGEFLHTRNNTLQDSPGIRVFQNKKGHLASSDILKKRETEIKRACERKAREIVLNLKSKGLLSDFDFKLISDESVIREMNHKVKVIFEEVFGARWGDEV